MSKNVYQIYDQNTDAYTAWAADSEEGAIAQYVAENPLDLSVTLVWEKGYQPVDGDDVQRFPVGRWRAMVAGGATELGYADWLAEKLQDDLRGI